MTATHITEAEACIERASALPLAAEARRSLYLEAIARVLVGEAGTPTPEASPEGASPMDTPEIIETIIEAIATGHFVKIADGKRSHTGEIAWADDDGEVVAVYTGGRGRPPKYAVASIESVEIVEEA